MNDISALLLLPPNHLINHSSIALNELHDLGADVFVNVIWNRDTVISVLDHFYGCINGLQERVLVDAGEDEAAFVKGFRSLGGCADADSRERVAYACEE